MEGEDEEQDEEERKILDFDDPRGCPMVLLRLGTRSRHGQTSKNRPTAEAGWRSKAF